MFLGCLGGRPRNPPLADHFPSPCLTQALCSLPFGPQTVLLSVTIPPPVAMELYRVPSSLLATHSGGFSWLTAGHRRRQVREGQWDIGTVLPIGQTQKCHGSQTWRCIRATCVLVQLETLGPTPRVSDSVSLGPLWSNRIQVSPPLLLLLGPQGASCSRSTGEAAWRPPVPQPPAGPFPPL